MLKIGDLLRLSWSIGFHLPSNLLAKLYRFLSCVSLRYTENVNISYIRSYITENLPPTHTPFFNCFQNQYRTQDVCCHLAYLRKHFIPQGKSKHTACCRLPGLGGLFNTCEFPFFFFLCNTQLTAFKMCTWTCLTRFYTEQGTFCLGLQAGAAGFPRRGTATNMLSSSPLLPLVLSGVLQALKWEASTHDAVTTSAETQATQPMLHLTWLLAKAIQHH